MPLRFVGGSTKRRVAIRKERGAGAAAAMVHIVHNVSGVADLDRHFLLCSEGLCGVLSAVRGRSATVVKTFTSLGAGQRQ